MKQSQLILALAALCTSTVFAGGAVVAPVSALSGFYLRGGAGMGRLDTPSMDKVFPVTSGSVSREGYSTQLGGFVGEVAVGYLFNPEASFSFGAELGYMYLSDSTYKAAYGGSIPFSLSAKYTGYPITLLGVVSYTYNNVLSLYLRGGAAYQSQTLVIHGMNGGGSLSYKDHKVLPAIGFGLGYHFGDHLIAGVNYLRTFGQTAVFDYSAVDASTILAKANRVTSINAVTGSLTYML